MTPDATQTERVAPVAESAPDALRDLISRARVVLWDFDGPICRLFAGHSAERVAAGLVAWLAEQGRQDLLTDAERKSADPHAVLRAVDRRSPRDGDRPADDGFVAALEERLTQEELRAVPKAMPTAYADPLIRTWTARGSRLAVTTNNSPRVVRTYLETRGLLGCFAPHIYGRTRDLGHLKPDPRFLHRALSAMDAESGDALMIGDTPSDLEAARRAGVPFLGYARNERKERALREAGARTVVTSLEQILQPLR
ncbi:HAD family hydrolase [Streptomyces sp. NPDC085946]|uniref:HAD family hydrolase n=1 Tax=Streptomyces sp. NPDC085946 TaxID=3365744 RepID=UPI0037D72B06